MMTVIVTCGCGSIAELLEDLLTVLCLGQCGLKHVRDEDLEIIAVSGDVVAYIESLIEEAE